MTAPRDKAFPVSWDQFHRDARALAWRLAGSGPFERARHDHPRRPGAGGDRGARTRDPGDRDGLHRLLPRLQDARRPPGAQDHRARDRAGSNDGAKILIVDDLVDTGATAKMVREMLPKAHFATVYAKPLGRPMVDTFITEVSQDTWIYFPWDMGLAFQPPIAGDGG